MLLRTAPDGSVGKVFLPARPVRLLLAAALGFVLTGRAGAAGLVTASAGTTASSTISVTLVIPGIIGIDVESDVSFDLTALSPASSPTSCTNAFPAGSSCPSGIYSPTAVTTTPGAVPAPAPGAIYISLLDATVGSVATKNVKHSVAAAWTGTNPGIPTTDIQTQRAVSSNGGLGGASFAALPTVQTAMPNGSAIPNGPFVWLRQDQAFQLVIPRAQSPSQTANASAIVTYTFSRS